MHDLIDCFALLKQLHDGCQQIKKLIVSKLNLCVE